MEPIADKVKEILPCNRHNVNMMPMGDNILADELEAVIDENW